MLVVIMVLTVVDTLMLIGLVTPGVADIVMSFFFGRETEEEDLWSQQYPESYVTLGVFYRN